MKKLYTPHVAGQNQVFLNPLVTTERQLLEACLYMCTHSNLILPQHIIMPTFQMKKVRRFVAMKPRYIQNTNHVQIVTITTDSHTVCFVDLFSTLAVSWSRAQVNHQNIFNSGSFNCLLFYILQNSCDEFVQNTYISFLTKPTCIFVSFSHSRNTRITYFYIQNTTPPLLSRPDAGLPSGGTGKALLVWT